MGRKVLAKKGYGGWYPIQYAAHKRKRGKMQGAIPRIEKVVDGSVYIGPIWLRIDLGCRVIYRNCHYYIVGADGVLDLLRADKPYGELKKFTFFNNVSSVEEVDGPPADDVPPVEQPREEGDHGESL